MSWQRDELLEQRKVLCQSLRELNAVIRKKQCKPRHTQPCLMEGVFLLTAGDLDGSRVAGKFRAAWKERDEVEAPLRAASESEMLAMMVYWLEGSTAVAQQARNLVKERELVAWIEEQNEERGYAPIYKEVYSKKMALDHNGDNGGAIPDDMRKTPRKWLQRFPKRWDLHRGILREEDNTSATLIAEQVKPQNENSEPERGRIVWTVFRV